MVWSNSIRPVKSARRYLVHAFVWETVSFTFTFLRLEPWRARAGQRYSSKCRDSWRIITRGQLLDPHLQQLQYPSYLSPPAILLETNLRKLCYSDDCNGNIPIRDHKMNTDPGWSQEYTFPKLYNISVCIYTLDRNIRPIFFQFGTDIPFCNTVKKFVG